MKQTRLIHPILFAVFPAISLVSDHNHFLRLDFTIALIGLGAILFAGLYFTALRVFIQDHQKTGLITTLTLGLFFSYGHVFEALEVATPGFDLRHRYLAVLWAILFLSLSILILRTRVELFLVTRFLNFMGGLLVLISISQILIYEASTYKLWVPEDIQSAPVVNEDGKNAPDIYYIILDSYGRSSTLQNYYDFDNSQFLEWLRGKGFFIADESHSNYATTTLSLASSLNMVHITSLSETVDEVSDDLEIPFQMIENSTVQHFLKSQGYRFVFIGSGRGVFNENRYADEDIRCGFIDETLGRLIQTSFLRVFADPLFTIRNDERARILCMFTKLAEVPAQPGPKFILAHFPTPHTPFLFDSKGNPVHSVGLSKQKIRKSYIEQLIFINSKTTDLIDAILLKSDVEPIIILQSDTGPPYVFGGTVYPDNPSPELYRERMEILYSIYLPEGPAKHYYESITPVNTFRLLFNSYFGTELELLEDEVFFSSLAFPYKFQNVTTTVKGD